MRTFLAALLSALLLAPALAAAAEAKAVIPVAGMHCGGCAAHVDEALGKVAGVKKADTDVDKAETVVVYDPAQVKPEALVKAIEKAGYKPGTPKVN